MNNLSFERLQNYRKKTFCTLPGLRLKSVDEAVDFVNRRGFIFFWPIKDIVLPSLWMAANGDRPVPNDHDDPGHVTWDWKDSMLGKHKWYYARILRRRNMMVSLDTLPYFYALSPNYGDYENDYMEQYMAGTLTQEARQVYEALLTKGPLDTQALRRESHLQNSTSDTRFARALDDLQIQFKILPIGVAPVGRWKYAFIYDITPRHFPDLMNQSRPISEPSAWVTLLEKYFLSVGAARIRDIKLLFHWRSEDLIRSIETLKSKYAITDHVQLSNSQDEWLALSELTQT